ncbi:pleckstrin homology domain-containing family G member 3-like [Nerophis ophidion]|uniref:pleckstrin homology domain-containing family G member 3-like n=1 Tax=Nerophis ophidion TaxID=159077 RepID=UPI002AE09491|nr:pleckstrin homology domain-containing family G member 3-like [Nerophis ophidion]XP_061757402.1 pleckstrin homology domain-containing family G member 3-like [Nerophis ophidion]XP_061757403.1 pleckstrin homology domain-containing family G member 3-like [Nerophis ophidion]XP_061757404.1 pleckstrin homology domain-containing family G member 3-like [Nerophis ophidion]XP_061757405.1 pleckstrin homology domain-containing family G member 3-like [Nerophis ophidion]
MTENMVPNVQSTYLDRVVMEIIETERAYVRDLRMIVEDYLAHIIDQVDLAIRPEQVCFLFGNIEDIYEFNSELLQDLDLCDRDAVAVAKCFVMKSQYFDIYTQYCTNYPNSVLALTECMQDSSLAIFFQSRQNTLKSSLPLGSYLLKPVQRILKYHLLLQEIAKHFDPEEEGYEVVEEAISTMTSVAWYINDMKRKHEHAVRLQEVQSLLLNWKGPDLTTYGELVLEGTFKVHRAKNERTLFLLEQVLLITKRRGEHYIYKAHISCSTLMLIESNKDSLSFSVAHYKQPKQPHTVQAKSVEEKEMWAHHIKRTILETHHAIIPQKAKDAILNSRYNHKYHSIPIRVKKVKSRRLTDGFPRQQSLDVNGGEKSLTGQVGVVSKDKGFFFKQESGFGGDAGNDAAAGQMSKNDLLAEEVLKSLRSPHSRTLTEKLKLDEVPGGEEEPPLQCKPSSSGESSENEDSDRSGSILPSSVLDKAGVIAQHFSSIKRSVPVQDDVCLVEAFPRSSGTTKPTRPSLQLNRIGSDVSDVTASTDMTLYSPRGDVERGGLRRRDSILSSPDQLLIGKIKTYYDNRDANFDLQRRESITYIPAGLVKTSVRRLNSTESISLPSAVEQPSLELYSPSSAHDHRFSTDCLDAQIKEDPKGSWLTTRAFPTSGSQSVEDFRPSSEMVHIWQVMEQQLGETSSLSDTPSRRHQEEGGASDMCAVTKKSSVPSHLKVKTNQRNHTGSLTNAPIVFPAEVPQVVGKTADEDDKAESKVRHLARQFSQRIKMVNPLARQQNDGILTSRKKLACVDEESTGQPNLSLGTVFPVGPINPVRSVSPGGTCPRSSSSIEGFNWPDVRELRSKYSDHSVSTSQQMSDLGPQRRSCSYSSAALSEKSFNKQTTIGHESYKQIHRTNSLDPWFIAAHRSKRTELQGRLDANGTDSDDCVAAEGLLETPTEDLIVTKTLLPEEEAASKDEDMKAFVQIRSPISREKISILAVMDRCRVYKESEEYKQRSEPIKSFNEGPQSINAASEPKNTVRSLTLKFQNLNS